MTIVGPRPLNRTQATSVLALRSVRATDDVRVLGYVAELIAIEARPKTIRELTGVATLVVQKMYEREVIRPTTGRRKTTIGDLLVKPRQHMEVSFFVARYAYYWLQDDKQVLAPGFLRAYRQYRGIATDETLVTPEAALLLARFYDSGEVLMARCDVCGLPFLRSSKPIRINWSHGHGDCPLCRALSSKDSKRAVLVNFEIAAARKTFERLKHGMPNES